MGFWQMFKQHMDAQNKARERAFYITVNLMNKYGWQWKQPKKEREVNLSLLQRPKKIKAGTKTAFVYAPCELTVNPAIDPGEAINIIDVFEGNTPEETTLKVMRHSDWVSHTKGYYQPDDEMQCTTRNESYDRKADPCHCHMEPSDMPESFRAKIHYVLLTDVGK